MKGIKLMLHSLIGVVLCLTLSSPILSVMNPTPALSRETSVLVNIGTDPQHIFRKPEGYEEHIELRDYPYLYYEEHITLRDEPYEIPDYTETEPVYYYWEVPTYWDVIEDKHPVLVECEDWELETLIRTMFLEAGAESDECIRAVTDVAFNQLNSGKFGATLSEVLYHPGNYTETVYRAWSVNPEDTARVREIVLDVYRNGISLPAQILYYRNQYFHDSWWCKPEFMIDNVYFSSAY